jgi:RNA polymerase sigma-70 factor (ECF subfamily)
MTEAAVKKAAQRLRERYGACLRRRVAGTLDDPDQIDDEIRGLFAALAGG